MIGKHKKILFFFLTVSVLWAIISSNRVFAEIPQEIESETTQSAPLEEISIPSTKLELKEAEDIAEDDLNNAQALGISDIKNIVRKGVSKVKGIACLNVTDSWDTTARQDARHTGVNSPNLQQTMSGSIHGSMMTMVTRSCPMCTCSGLLFVMENPEDLTVADLGLVGVIENNTFETIASFPTVDIPSHLAKEWIPGADPARNAVYADSGYQYLLSTNIDVLWSKTRAIAYSLMVITLIIIGFAIMFRSKLGGQTSVTIFNSIPRVVVGLLLITFSFAIVGIMIDFGAVMVRIVAQLFADQINTPLVVDTPLSILGGVFDVFSGRTTGLKLFGAGLGLSTIITGLSQFFSGGFSVRGLLGTGGIVVVFIYLFIIGVLLFVSVRVYFVLLKSLVLILLDTVMLPLYIVMGIVPGRGSIITTAFRRLTKSILTFPVVFFFVNVGFYINALGLKLTFPDQFTAGFSGGSALIGQIGAFFLPVICFYYAAEAPKMIDSFLKGEKNSLEAANQSVKNSISKIPVVGSIVGG